MPRHFFWGHYTPALHPGFSGLWGSPPALSSTPTQHGAFFVFWMPRHPVFNSPPYPWHSQATYGYLPLTVQHLCYLWGAMPRQRSPGAFPPTVPREAENFPRGDKHFKLYDHPNLWIIYSLQDLIPFYGELSMLRVLFFNRLAVELDDWQWIKALLLTFTCIILLLTGFEPFLRKV